MAPLYSSSPSRNDLHQFHDVRSLWDLKFFDSDAVPQAVWRQRGTCVSIRDLANCCGPDLQQALILSVCLSLSVRIQGATREQHANGLNWSLISLKIEISAMICAYDTKILTMKLPNFALHSSFCLYRITIKFTSLHGISTPFIASGDLHVIPVTSGFVFKVVFSWSVGEYYICSSLQILEIVKHSPSISPWGDRSFVLGLHCPDCTMFFM